MRARPHSSCACVRDCLPERVQDRTAGLLAGHRLELQEWSVGLLFQRGVESSNGHDQARGFLCERVNSVYSLQHGGDAITVGLESAYHARAWEDVPAQADTIAILDLTPLLLESFVVHLATVSVPTNTKSSVALSDMIVSTAGGECVVIIGLSFSFSCFSCG